MDPSLQDRPGLRPQCLVDVSPRQSNPMRLTSAGRQARTISVALRDRPYEIHIAAGLRHQLGDALAACGISSGTKVLVVTNPAVDGPYGAAVSASLKTAGFHAECLVIAAGEEQKTMAGLATIHAACFRQRLERGSLIVALGGGVVGDMAGFAAATWLRGIAVVQVPTTLLAMVDASIGGKTGVNHPGGKNLIGAFHQPRLVLIDPETLETLPQREFRAGMAEVIKYGVISDVALFERLERHGPLNSVSAVGAELLQALLEASTAAKARVVAADELEGGLRAILNYGHSLGHALESLSGYGTYLHGEAVALGMHAIGLIAQRMGAWTAAEQQRQARLIEACGLPLVWPSLDVDAVLDCLQRDKKVRGGKVRFVLPRAIGRVEITAAVETALVGEVVSELMA